MSIVTVFGRPGALTSALADELEAHAFACHLMSVPVGWWEVASRSAVVMADSVAGEAALRELAVTPAGDEPAGVLVVASATASESTAAAWRELCSLSRTARDVTLAWCRPIDEAGPGAVQYASAAVEHLQQPGAAPIEISPEAFAGPR